MKGKKTKERYKPEEKTENHQKHREEARPWNTRDTWMETNKPAKSEGTTQAQIQTELMRGRGADGETLETQVNSK